MIEIPERIDRQIGAAPCTIPCTFIQTYKGNRVHKKVYENTMGILRSNPEFDYRLVTDRDAVKLIVENFGRRELTAFCTLKNGAARGDFARYVALYVYGGIYMDLDCQFEGRFLDHLDFGKDFIFLIDHGTSLVQCFFAIRPRHPIMKLILEACCDQIENRVPNIFKATGPSIFTSVIYREVLGEAVDRKNLPLAEGVMQINNPLYRKGTIYKLYRLNEIDDRHYRRFWYKFPAYADSMLYESPDEIYTVNGVASALYHTD